MSTPGRIAQLIGDGSLQGALLQQRLQTLVLDEADLLLSYGYEGDLQALAPLVPRSCQCLLMSATTSDDVERLTQLLLHNPITLDLLKAATSEAAVAAAADGDQAEDRGPGDASGISETVSHYYYKCRPQDKLLGLLCLAKLGLIQKKVLIFVNDINAGYRARLLLEAFGIRSTMLNAELPLNTRHHILQQFNKARETSRCPPPLSLLLHGMLSTNCRDSTTF